MTDNIFVDGKLVYLSTGMRCVYVFDRTIPPLGRGGMGQVYLGYNCRNGARVAVKQLHPHLSSIPWLRKRTREESSLTFSHPNIVEMHGCCESRSGKGPLFVISSFVSGKNIDDFVNSSSALNDADDRAERIVTLLLPLFDALEFLHRQNIHHLDIKPSNIMIDSFSTVRLMDLGVANSSMDVGCFGDNEFGVIGTPSYAAPEQFIIPGKSSHVDGRADLYEMAVAIYKLICNTNPYDSKSVEESYRLHSENALPEHIALPKRIYDVLVRATDPEPDNRYPTAEEMKNALKEAITPPKKRRFWPFS